MFGTVVIATDGSETAARAIDVALNLADRFDADVHALYVLDTAEVEAAPERLRAEMREALEDRGSEALAAVRETADVAVETAVREGRPPSEISSYARSESADVVVMGTRGRHGGNRFLVGNVAERVVRTCPVPVLTVRRPD